MGKYTELSKSEIASLEPRPVRVKADEVEIVTETQGEIWRAG